MSESKFDPRRPHKVWIPDFEDAPEAERPTFTYRRLSADEYDQICGSIDRDDEGNRLVDSKQMTARLYEDLKIGLLGWDNQIDPSTGEAVPFDVDNIRSVINPREAMALRIARQIGGRLYPDEKKRLESPA